MMKNWEKKANKALHAIGLKYWDYIPMEEIESVLEECGDTYPLQEDGEAFQGFFCGREGRADLPLKDSKRWLHMTWYKMLSGRFEIVAYVN